MHISLKLKLPIFGLKMLNSFCTHSGVSRLKNIFLIFAIVLLYTIGSKEKEKSFSYSTIMIIKKLFHTMINIHKKNKVIEQKLFITKKKCNLQN